MVVCIEFLGFNFQFDREFDQSQFIDAEDRGYFGISMDDTGYVFVPDKYRFMKSTIRFELVFSALAVRMDLCNATFTYTCTDAPRQGVN